MQKSGISENEQMLNKPIKTERWYDNQISVWHEFHIISEPQQFFSSMYKLDFGTTKCPKIINANELYRFSEIIHAFSKMIIIFG